MPSDEKDLRDILERAHAAWTRGNLDETLKCYDDQIVYSGNIGGPGGKPLVYTGKTAMRAFLEPILVLAECISTPLTFVYRDGVGRAQIHFQLRHKKTGNVLRGTFRQIVKFRDGKITSLDEFRRCTDECLLVHGSGSDEPGQQKPINHIEVVD